MAVCGVCASSTCGDAKALNVVGTDTADVPIVDETSDVVCISVESVDVATTVVVTVDPWVEISFDVKTKKLDSLISNSNPAYNFDASVMPACECRGDSLSSAGPVVEIGDDNGIRSEYVEVKPVVKGRDTTTVNLAGYNCGPGMEYNEVATSSGGGAIEEALGISKTEPLYWTSDVTVDCSTRAVLVL